MLVSLVKLDFVSAFRYNSFLLVTGPLLVAYLVCGEVRYVLYGSRKMEKVEKFMWIELGLAIAFGILRNIFPI